MANFCRLFVAASLLQMLSSLGIAEARGKDGQENRTQSPKVPTHPVIRQILDWLPTDTETIFVSQVPFKWGSGGENEGKVPPLARHALMPLGLLPGNEQAAEEKQTGPRYLKPLKGLTVSLALEGSRGFRSPADIGLMFYDGCSFIVFERDLGPLRADLNKALKADASKLERIADHEVYVFDTKMRSDQWHLFVTQPKPEILLVATDAKYLEEVLKRMAVKEKAKNRALPPELPEWKELNLKAPVWAIRHYDKKHAAKDGSSPLAGEDPQAVGLVFALEPGKKDVATVKYLSANKSALQYTTQFWNHPEEKLVPRIKQKSKGVVEITVNLNDEKTRAMFDLVLLWALGHGILL
jgi:hypothetical protein